MTELDIYKFVHDNGLEIHWQDFYEKGKCIKKLNLWIPSYLVKDFCEMLGNSAFDDSGICDVSLCCKGDIFIENFDEVLECADIDPERILKKE